ncbi:3709_t:CDS:1, partial [Entrophospora sp. SA101]
TRGHTPFKFSSKSSSSKHPYITPKSKLPLERLIVENNHLPEYRENKIA